jgi:D-alanyl-D-alanine-carboxypeptidase/D-alanyl-D-alanine-endopeptidase
MREGSGLLVQASGQDQFAEGERYYFHKVVDAQITFETDAVGRAIKLILHHNGRDTPAPRMEAPMSDTSRQ